MGTIDISQAEHPKRRRRDGSMTQMAAHFLKRFPPEAKRHSFLRNVLFDNREAPVNPMKTEIEDAQESTAFIKELVLKFGADLVGVAEYNPKLRFDTAEEYGHKYVIVFAMSMGYDIMADIGPRSQDEVHRAYYSLDDIGVRIAQQIGAFGYSARM